MRRFLLVLLLQLVCFAHGQSSLSGQIGKLGDASLPMVELTKCLGSPDWWKSEAWKDWLDQAMDSLVVQIHSKATRPTIQILRTKIEALQNLGNELSQESTRRWADAYAALSDSEFAEKLKGIAKDLGIGDAPPDEDLVILSWCPPSRELRELARQVVRARPETALSILRTKGCTIQCFLLEKLAESNCQAALPDALRLSHDGNITKRAAAADALGSFGGAVAFNRLVEMNSDSSVIVRNSAGRSLYSADPVRGLPLAVRIACTEPVEALQTSALWSLSDADPDMLAGAIQPYLRGTDTRILVNALDLLLGHPSQMNQKVLVELSAHKEREVRVSAIRALGEVPGSISVTTLTVRLQHRDPDTRARAVASLSGRDDFDQWHLIAEMLDDSVASVVIRAARRWANTSMLRRCSGSSNSRNRRMRISEMPRFGRLTPSRADRSSGRGSPTPNPLPQRQTTLRDWAHPKGYHYPKR